MKTKIIISGSPHSMYEVAHKLGENTEKSHLGLVAKFNTKKEAIKALSNAYQGLKTKIIDTHGSLEYGTYFSYKRGHSLGYDDSKATISEY